MGHKLGSPFLHGALKGYLVELKKQGVGCKHNPEVRQVNILFLFTERCSNAISMLGGLVILVSAGSQTSVKRHKRESNEDLVVKPEHISSSVIQSASSAKTAFNQHFFAVFNNSLPKCTRR